LAVFPGNTNMSMNMSMEHWWTILTGENRNTRRKTCPRVTFSTKSFTWTGLGLNPGLQGERPAFEGKKYSTLYLKIKFAPHREQWCCYWKDSSVRAIQGSNRWGVSCVQLRATCINHLAEHVVATRQ
jgi:hypothetical protein